MLFSVFFRGDKFCPVISLGFFFFFEAQGIFWGFWFLPPIRFPNSIEHNQTDWVRLSSICSIEFDLFGNRTHWKCGVRFRSIAELNRTQSTDWVRLSSIFERSIYYAGDGCILFTRRGIIHFPFPHTICLFILFFAAELSRILQRLILLYKPLRFSDRISIIDCIFGNTWRVFGVLENSHKSIPGLDARIKSSIGIFWF